MFLDWPKPVVFATSVELILIGLTCLLWLQPFFLFRGNSGRISAFSRKLGWLVFILSFFWSIYLGIVLYGHDIVV